MDPYEYILELLRKFNERNGSEYPQTRAYSIMRCYVENKIEYYPVNFNKYDWLFSTICKQYVTTGKSDAKFALPPIPIYNPSLYAFLVIDYYRVVDYKSLFSVIRYDMNLSSTQTRQLSKSPYLASLVEDLYNNKDGYVGFDRMFDALKMGTRIKKPGIKRKSEVEDIELDFKTMKL